LGEPAPKLATKKNKKKKKKKNQNKNPQLVLGCL
jgi:hypothetical protein